MNEKKLITIIIPVFNSEKYIEKCLKSVLNQTYQNIEIIVIIDGATDNSENIITTIAKKDNRIKIISRENKGVQYSRMEGYKNATGDYILFVDSDDYIKENAVEKLVLKADKYNADIVKCNYILEKTKKEKINKYSYIKSNVEVINKKYFKSHIYPDFIDTYIYNNMWGQLIKTEKIDIKYFDCKLIYAEDFVFNMNLYSNIQTIVREEEPLYYYNIHSQGATRNKDINKMINMLGNATDAYFMLFDFLNIWQMDTVTNRKKIAIRILNENFNILEKISMSNIKYKDIIDILVKLSENKKIKKIMSISNKEDIITLSSTHKKELLLFYDENYEKISKYYINIIKPRKIIKNYIKNILEE